MFFLFFLILLLILILICKMLQKKNITDKINKCYANIVTPEEAVLMQNLLIAWSEVAEKFDISWSACAGTALGARRHKGRIPWDDDIDITIALADVEKLPKAFLELKAYEIDTSKFWGGYKIFYPQYSKNCKYYHKKYGWGWPFIDLFVKPNDQNCAPLEDDEQLEWIPFDNIVIPVIKNGYRGITNLKKKGLMDSMLDTGYRHRIESFIPTKCQPIKKN